LPRYLQYLIEGYSFKPDYIDYKPNDIRRTQTKRSLMIFLDRQPFL